MRVILLEMAIKGCCGVKNVVNCGYIKDWAVRAVFGGCSVLGMSGFDRRTDC